MRSLVVAAAAAAFALHAEVGQACTLIGVGKDASASGAPLVAHTEDSGGQTNDIRLTRVPRRKWPKGSQRPLYKVTAWYPRLVDAERSPEYAPVGDQVPSVPLGYIPQVEETWGYWDMDYGAQNEWGVSIGESTCTAMTVGWPSDLPYGYNKVGIEEMSKIALERCKTARCAAQTMGDIAVEHGFFSSDSATPDKPGYSGSSECLGIADASTGELWNFHVLTGRNNASAIWAAQRMPSDHVIAVGNSFTIRKMNLRDPDNFLYSPGVSELAEEKGWWSPELESSPDVFDFYYAYGYTPPADVQPPNMASTLGYYSSRRMWRIFSLLSPEEGAKLDPEKGNLPHQKDPYPSSVPAPKGSVSVKMVSDVLKDHYEGTPYDLTVGMAAGPFGSPNRGPGDKGVVGQWERAISMYRTTWSFVNEAKPDRLSILWFGLDSPHGTAYLPFYGAATTGGPESYHSHEGTMSKFSTKVAWWSFNLINQYTQLNFGLINKEVKAKAAAVEAKSRAMVQEWEREAALSMEANPDGAMAMLTERSNGWATEVVGHWWEFAWHLVAKYRSFDVTYNDSETGFTAGVYAYPAWWLKSADVGFTTWTNKGPYHGVPDSVAAAAIQDAALQPGVPVTVVAAGALASLVAIFVAFQAGKAVAPARDGPAQCGYVTCDA